MAQSQLYAHSVQSQYNHASQSCTCTYIYAPPPCVLMGNNTWKPITGRTRANREEEVTTTPLMISNESTPHSNRTPWNAVVNQLVNSLEKVRRKQTRSIAKEWRTGSTPKRDFDTNLEEEILPFRELISGWFDRLKSKRPSNQRINRLKLLHNRTVVTSQQLRKIPRPLEVLKHFETLGQLYIFALFEQICSFDFHRAPAEVLPLCMEYYFSSWPFQVIPDFHCNYSPSPES